jgi:starch synthase (maltosyl-transferring)
VGETFEVGAVILREGHEALAAVLRYRPVKDTAWHETRMEPLGNDRWVGRFALTENTRYVYTIEAYADAYRTWAEDLRKRVAAGMEVGSELLEGAALLRQTLSRATGADRRRLEACLAAFEGAEGPVARARLLLAEEVAGLVEAYPDRSGATRYDRELEVVVDRPRARFAAWYELFPRSQSRVPGAHGTFKDCLDRLADLDAMGFDVVYLPPIHPIGRSFRKGTNNRLTAEPGDPGSPWAIGNEDGGHKAVEPALGSLDDFRALVRAARDRGMEIALDYALQCSPDHPYVRDHPEWFHARPDGTIKYAENPPKKYQDIYPLNFYGDEWEEQWEEWKSVILYWVEQGVKIFRVDNPHTKPVQFWQWMIREVQREHPEVLFLSEAFTRPKMMRALAKAGFSQSYTYFTWRNFKWELEEYFTELTQGPMKEYFRGNLFPNTPDINPEFLQTGGRPAFIIRAVLAATLSSVYGIYSGFELCEATPLPGREEYMDSEKYQLRAWDWDRPGNIRELITRLNQIRRENPALQEYDNLRFHLTDSDQVLFYEKSSADGKNTLFVAVNLDPFDTHEATLFFPMPSVGVGEHEAWQADELVLGGLHLWQGSHQRVRLDPATPARIWRVRRLTRTEQEYEYFEGATVVGK